MSNFLDALAMFILGLAGVGICIGLLSIIVLAFTYFPMEIGFLICITITVWAAERMAN